MSEDKARIEWNAARSAVEDTWRAYDKARHEWQSACKAEEDARFAFYEGNPPY